MWGMNKYKFYIVFLVIIGLGISTFSFISSGYYPIALVDGNLIIARTFLNDYIAASSYYDNLVKAGQSASSSIPVLSREDIQKSVMAGLIENVLIKNGARKEIGGDLNRMVNEKVNEATNAPEMEKTVLALYGLNFGDFKKEILVPQAERDVLTGSLFLKGEKIEDWLAAAKKSSNIIIFSGKFYWNGQNVATR